MSTKKRHDRSEYASATSAAGTTYCFHKAQSLTTSSATFLGYLHDDLEANENIFLDGNWRPGRWRMPRKYNDPFLLTPARHLNQYLPHSTSSPHQQHHHFQKETAKSRCLEKRSTYPPFHAPRNLAQDHIAPTFPSCQERA
jgi:hypothetical protein